MRGRLVMQQATNQPGEQDSHGEEHMRKGERPEENALANFRCYDVRHPPVSYDVNDRRQEPGPLRVPEQCRPPVHATFRIGIEVEALSKELEHSNAPGEHEQRYQQGPAGDLEAATEDQTIPKTKIYLRQIPIDPMTGKADWDFRSCYDAADSTSWGGENVFDVRSKSDGKALNGEKYSDW